MGAEQRSDDTARLETFADGVMAIAITLLILEVRVPHVEGRGLGAALAHQWPSYAGFIVSFLTICVLPWPTALVADYVRSPDGRTLATAVYGGVMTSIAIMFNVVWRYAGTNHRLLVPGIAEEALAKMNRNYLAGPVVYGTATLVAFAQPFVSLALFAGLAVYWLLPGTGPRAEVLTAGS